MISADTGRIDDRFVAVAVAGVAVVARRTVAAVAALRTGVAVEALFLSLPCSDGVDVGVLVLEGAREVV